MIYSSLSFIYGFLPLSLLIYTVTPKKKQPLALLLLSMVFCGMFSLGFLVFMVLYVLINFCGCRIIDQKKQNGKKGLLPFAACMLVDLFSVMLFRSELLSFVRDEIVGAALFFPVGISFFTLSAIGTLADVYKGRIKAEKNIICFGLYIMMFPRLIMGPVLRYASFSRALAERKTDLCEIGKGFTVFVKGLAKKVLFADALYMLYMDVSGIEVTELSAVTAWLGAAAYLLCLYFTFSGFGDMGIGLGMCFGFKFPKSFNYPMFSTKIRYFYARWHTQIIKWFRKNLTLPLYALSRRKIYRKLVFLFVWGILGWWYTFDVNGLLWGVFIGIVLTVEKRFDNAKVITFTGVLYTFVTVLIGTVIFFGSSPAYSARYLLAMIGGNGVFADALSMYLLKSYVVILLICMYASTDLFRNVRLRIEKTKGRLVFEIFQPVVIPAILIICTALMSAGGSSGTMLLIL